MSESRRWWRRLLMRYILLLQVMGLMLLVGCRAQHSKDEARFEAERAELMAAHAAELRAASSTAQRRATEALPEYHVAAEYGAKVLYGYRNNSEADLRKVCNCFCNRTEHYMFPDTIEEVCQQEFQWMGYSDDNPVLEHLYQIALEEITAFYDGSHRTVAPEYIYLSWSSEEIVLRDTFEETSRTHYWR